MLTVGSVGAVTGGLLGKIGGMALNPFERGLAHGAVHGGAAEATGGEFRHGFYSGFLSGSLDGRIESSFQGNEAAQYAAAAVVGGTGSVIGGGKFANGAVSGAFSYMFNQQGGLSNWWKKASGWVHGVLDVAGFVPLIGEIADGVNAGIYLLERDYGNAAISAAAMVPLVGSVGTAARLGVKGTNLAVDASKGVAIRNAHLAGKVHPKTGIPFDSHGFPDFSGVSTHSVSIQQTGNRAADYAAANRAANLNTTPRGYTWHHHQDRGVTGRVKTRHFWPGQNQPPREGVEVMKELRERTR